jgi:hypothetical protein
MFKLNYGIVILLTNVDDNNIIVLFVSLSLKFKSLINFAPTWSIFQRVDKDQEMLLN